MHICFIGSFAKIHDEEGIAQALERAGHTVSRRNEITLEHDDIKDIIDSSPDMVLMAKFKNTIAIKDDLIRACKKKGIKTVVYVPDLFFGLGRELRVSSDPIFRADIVCTPDGGHEEKWKEKGVNHKVVRQGIPPEYCFVGKKKALPYEIVFVGSHNPEFPYRTDLMRRLKQRYGERFHWIGRDYSDECRGSDLNDLYASVKVVVGDSVYSPYYWSNRIYETLGRGGCLIHPITEGLDKEFRPYVDFMPYNYSDYDGLFHKIDYLLMRGDVRDDMRKNGMNTVKNKYTLDQRITQLLTYV